MTQTTHPRYVATAAATSRLAGTIQSHIDNNAEWPSPSTIVDLAADEFGIEGLDLDPAFRIEEILSQASQVGLGPWAMAAIAIEALLDEVSS